MPPLIIAGGALITALLVAVVVLLAMTLGEMRTSRQHIESQDARTKVLLRRSRPTFEQVPTLAEQAEPLLRRAAPLAGSLLAARPEVADIGNRLPPLISALQGLANEGIPLARGLRSSDLPSLVTELSGSGLPTTMASLQRLLTDLESGDRLTRALDISTDVMSQVQALHLPRRAVASSRRLRELLALQRRTFGILTTSLDVQRRTLSHTRSIDNKLGGQLPPLSGG